MDVGEKKRFSVQTYYWKKADLLARFPLGTAEIVESVLSDVKDQESCLRWHARGLTLYDSIRKVLVDIEVRENAFGGRNR